MQDHYAQMVRGVGQLRAGAEALKQFRVTEPAMPGAVMLIFGAMETYLGVAATLLERGLRGEAESGIAFLKIAHDLEAILVNTSNTYAAPKAEA